jgi:hypothetical protein
MPFDLKKPEFAPVFLCLHLMASWTSQARFVLFDQDCSRLEAESRSDWSIHGILVFPYWDVLPVAAHRSLTTVCHISECSGVVTRKSIE